MNSFLRTADIDTDHYEENCDVHILPADKHLKYICFVRYEKVLLIFIILYLWYIRNLNNCLILHFDTIALTC